MERPRSEGPHDEFRQEATSGDSHEDFINEMNKEDAILATTALGILGGAIGIAALRLRRKKGEQ